MERPQAFAFVEPSIRRSAVTDDRLPAGPSAGVYLLGTKVVVGRERLGADRMADQQDNSSDEDQDEVTAPRVHVTKRGYAIHAPATDFELHAPVGGRRRTSGRARIQSEAHAGVVGRRDPPRAAYGAIGLREVRQDAVFARRDG